jgi:CTP synthase
VPKYIFVTGGVISSVGKGTIAASLGKILAVRGVKVDFLKIDPYVNVDAGTMNPYVHGEVYVTADGGETDLDLGWYERFTGITMSKLNNLTTGQVFSSVIEKERRGEYLGQCVQIIPHVTEEIKARIRKVSERRGADVVIVEIGGTVGDIEGLPFYEAARQMRLEEETLFVHVALVIYHEPTKEMKTKAFQHSIQELRRIGIQPDVIVARSPKMIGEEVRRKLALFGTLPKEAVFCSYDVSPVYRLPLVLEEQGLGDYVARKLGLPNNPDWSGWRRVVELYDRASGVVRIALCGKYTAMGDSYVSIREAIGHAAAHLGVRAEVVMVEAEDLERDPGALESLKEFDGILVAPGFGKRGTEGKIAAISFARRTGTPFMGICFGMQLAVVEFARNVLGLKGANSTELDPGTPHPVIDLLPEQRGGIGDGRDDEARRARGPDQGGDDSPQDLRIDVRPQEAQAQVRGQPGLLGSAQEGWTGILGLLGRREARGDRRASRPPLLRRIPVPPGILLHRRVTRAPLHGVHRGCQEAQG